jgi:hypothetical protein
MFSDKKNRWLQNFLRIVEEYRNSKIAIDCNSKSTKETSIWLRQCLIDFINKKITYLYAQIIQQNTTYQSALWLDKRPVLAVHFVVEAAGITQIMAISISSP